MTKSGVIVVLLLVFVAALLAAGCSQAVQEPTVTVTNITVTNVSLQSTTLETNLTIENPNPVGATIANLTFDLYYLADGERQFLGQGEEHGIEVAANGPTNVTVPVVVLNEEVIRAFIGIVEAGSVDVIANGTATIDLGVTTYDVPFEETRTITRQMLVDTAREQRDR
jgi:LEA14-like dessication related protein